MGASASSHSSLLVGHGVRMVLSPPARQAKGPKPGTSALLTKLPKDQQKTMSDSKLKFFAASADKLQFKYHGTYNMKIALSFEMF